MFTFNNQPIPRTVHEVRGILRVVDPETGVIWLNILKK